MGVHNPGEHQHIDRRRLGAQQRPRAGIDGGAGSQDIVDQDDAAAGDFGATLRGNLERTLHIAGALRARQPICCSVARMRRSASEASLTPLWREITRASAPDWL